MVLFWRARCCCLGQNSSRLRVVAVVEDTSVRPIRMIEGAVAVARVITGYPPTLARSFLRASTLSRRRNSPPTSQRVFSWSLPTTRYMSIDARLWHNIPTYLPLGASKYFLINRICVLQLSLLSLTVFAVEQRKED